MEIKNIKKLKFEMYRFVVNKKRRPVLVWVSQGTHTHVKMYLVFADVYVIECRGELFVYQGNIEDVDLNDYLI